MTDLEVLQKLGMCVNKAKVMLCPQCSDKDGGQPMCSWGDNPEWLFCPHCDLEVKLVMVDRGTWKDKKRSE